MTEQWTATLSRPKFKGIFNILAVIIDLPEQEVLERVYAIYNVLETLEVLLSGFFELVVQANRFSQIPVLEDHLICLQIRI